MKKVYLLRVIIGVVISLYLLSFFRQNTSSPLVAIDYILVEKNRHILSVYHQGQCVKKYDIALGFSSVGSKEQEGDGKTPEGKYYISRKNPQSVYHLSLAISYPSAIDQMVAMHKGFEPGKDIMIHGLRKGFGWIGYYHRLLDWTRGCIAVTNQEIEEIYQATKVGTVIEIKQ
jgi:murein L,D-transpeptidase YafK